MTTATKDKRMTFTKRSGKSAPAPQARGETPGGDGMTAYWLILASCLGRDAARIPVGVPATPALPLPPARRRAV